MTIVEARFPLQRKKANSFYAGNVGEVPAANVRTGAGVFTLRVPIGTSRNQFRVILKVPAPLLRVQVPVISLPSTFP